MRHLTITAARNEEDIYGGNYNILLMNIKEFLDKWREIPKL